MTRSQKGYGYAWLCDFGLCNWAEPYLTDLTSKTKPSPEAIAVRVELVPTLKRYRERVQTDKNE